MDIEQTLLPWLGKTMKMIHIHIQELFDEYGISLTKTQWVLLKKLNEKDGIPQQELAFLTGRDKASLTRLINTMEKKSMVTRIPSKLDKRINHIYLTKQGEALYQETLPIMEDFIASFQNNVSEEEIKQTIEIIKKVKDNLKIQSSKSCNS